MAKQRKLAWQTPFEQEVQGKQTANSRGSDADVSMAAVDDLDAAERVN